MKAKFYFHDPHAPKPNKPNHVGVTAIIKCDNKILFEKRSDSQRWALIGGGLKIDESLTQCLTREIFEETGINILKYKFLRVYDDPSRIVQYPDGNILRIITFVYFCELDNMIDLKLSGESTDLQFFSHDEISKLDIVETHKHIVDDYLRNNE